MSNLGTLYGLGVGPGDPELITVKAFRVFKNHRLLRIQEKEKEAKAMPIELLKCIFARRKGNAWACFSDDERSNHFRS